MKNTQTTTKTQQHKNKTKPLKHNNIKTKQNHKTKTYNTLKNHEK